MELPTWIDEEIWGEFIGHRGDLKKPMSERAQRMTLKKLEMMKARGLNPNEALCNSIMNGWQGVFDYEPKGKGDYKPASHSEYKGPDYGERTEPTAARNNIASIRQLVRKGAA